MIGAQDLIGLAIENGDRELRRHARADRCQQRVWWIAHHNLRLTDDEAEKLKDYHDKDVEYLRRECLRRRIKDARKAVLGHLGLNEVSEQKMLVRLRVTCAVTVTYQRVTNNADSEPVSYFAGCLDVAAQPR
eukprot:COSAG02_NODE_6547_length_3502_cov_58.042766_5_plen_132_part_00